MTHASHHWYPSSLAPYLTHCQVQFILSPTYFSNLFASLYLPLVYLKLLPPWSGPLQKLLALYTLACLQIHFSHYSIVVCLKWNLNIIMTLALQSLLFGWEQNSSPWPSKVCKILALPISPTVAFWILLYKLPGFLSVSCISHTPSEHRVLQGLPFSA